MRTSTIRNPSPCARAAVSAWSASASMYTQSNRSRSSATSRAAASLNVFPSTRPIARSKCRLSHSSLRIILKPGDLKSGVRSNSVAGLVHEPEVNSREVFSDDADREHLSAGEDGDDRGEEREARDRCALDEVSNQHIEQDQDTDEGGR